MTREQRVEARLADLAARHALPDPATRALAAVLEHLATDPAAPTAVSEPEAAVDIHVADSLAALDLPVVRDARRVADLGAGAGFPGLVLAATLPDAEVALVESAARKCAYLQRAVKAAGLANVQVVNARAEEWHQGVGTRDLVSARALAPLPVLVEYAAPLLALGGAHVAWKGHVEADEEADGRAAAEAVGLELAEVQPVQPFSGAKRLSLYVFVKREETPSRFPRRAGMAAKRPLGASS